jgi:signal transduction histidine kinase
VTAPQSFRRQLSIAAKLPLAVAFILSVVLLTLALAAYVEVRSSALTLASERLDQAGRQIVGLTTPQISRGIGQTKVEANSPETLAMLTEPGPPTPEASAAFIDRITRPRPGTTTTTGRPNNTIEIWNSGAERVFSHGPSLPPVPVALAAELASKADKDGVAIAPFSLLEGAVMQTNVGAAIVNGKTIGYLVDRRALSGATSLRTIQNLIFPNSRLLMVNAAGDVWNDFAKPVEMPATASAVVRTGDLVAYQRPDKVPVFARATAIPQTPWFMVVEFPQAPILAPVRRFVWRAAGLSVALAIAGAFVGWALSRRVTRPLKRMTEAAVAIAGGRRSERLALDRGDELGKLAGAFDTMVLALENSEDALLEMNADLEARVAARTTELEDANRELEAFTSSISNDLRAPLRAISGFSRIIVETHGADLPQDVGVHLRTINRSVRKMDQLIDDLLTFSRLSRQPIARGVTDMTALARGAIREVERSGTGRSFHFVLNPLPPARVERSLMRHVLDNLVQNAAKFTSTREHAHIEIGHTDDGGVPAYFVRDNGVGFDMQHADKLFGVFQRLHRPGEFDGTGVGLAIVHRIVSRHGGRVWAQSEVDRGATFYFTLPETPRHDA